MEEYTATEARKNFSECVGKAIKGKMVKIVNRANAKDAVVIIKEAEYLKMKAKYDEQISMIQLERRYKYITEQLNEIENMLRKNNSRSIKK